jgi:hypothetical protein
MITSVDEIIRRSLAGGDGHKIIRSLLSLSRLGSPHAQIVRNTLQSSSPWAILTL